MAHIAEAKMTEVSRSEPEPTRPTWKLALGILAIIIVAQVASHWHGANPFTG